MSWKRSWPRVFFSGPFVVALSDVSLGAGEALTTYSFLEFDDTYRDEREKERESVRQSMITLHAYISQLFLETDPGR